MKMLLMSLAFCLNIGNASVISRHGHSIALAIPVANAIYLDTISDKSAPSPDQTLSTTIQDPNHPGEPWVVTTYRRPDESFEAFVMRHKTMVDAVRKALS